MHSKFLQNTLISLSLFSFGLILVACDQTQSLSNDEKSSHHTIENATTADTPQQLKSGNLLYIVQDIANLQLKTGREIEQLQHTRQQLEDAVNLQDHAQLQVIATQLQIQLDAFNNTLNGLALKSQEIHVIREKLMTANRQILATPFLNGQIDLNQIDLKKIEQQINSIQTEMVKLAAMLMSEPTSDHATQAKNF